MCEWMQMFSKVCHAVSAVSSSLNCHIECAWGFACVRTAAHLQFACRPVSHTATLGEEAAMHS